MYFCPGEVMPVTTHKSGKPEPCLRFVSPPNASLPNDTRGATEPCLDGWAYNSSTGDSIVTEWDLVCDSNKLKEMAQSVFMAGTLVGGIVLGGLSDRFGRKPILSGSYLLLAASGSGAAFSPSFAIYMVLRFLCGFSMAGVTLSTVILNVEWMSTQLRAVMTVGIGYFYTAGQFILPGLAYAIPQWRWLQLTVSVPFFAFFLLSWYVILSPEALPVQAGQLHVEWMSTQLRAVMTVGIGYFYTAGQFILPGLAYAIPQWRWLQLTVSVPFFAFFLLSWWVPESIRWMVLSGKSPKALRILQWVAAFNGRKEAGEKLSLEAGAGELKLDLQKEISLAKAHYSVADLFRTPVLRRVTFCLSLAW
ncbi:Solute carrier family 22 member 8 [Myotis brandtii]|uniref:Solute carrier family 22 member 8 n=1 Tax=Myotis brandtii TaxID=109478 RepID=S7MEY8_MYOBR|nr:Solute carrier family 22 member 8 [Myotis brandtii]